VLTQAEPARSLKLAALLVPYALPSGAAKREPRVKVSYRRSAVVFEVAGHWGTDRVQCELSENEAAPASGPAIQVWRKPGHGRKAIFTSSDWESCVPVAGAERKKPK
jgi:hypothetical protein